MDNRERVTELVARADANVQGIRLADDLLRTLISAVTRFTEKRDALQRQLQAVNRELKSLGFHDSGHAKGELAKP